MGGLDLTGVIVAAIAAVLTFVVARNLRSRTSSRQEQLKELADEDYHQQVGP